MILHITQHDLDTAHYSDMYDCACARALKREFPDADIVVGGQMFYIDGKYFKLPSKAGVELGKMCKRTAKAFWMRIPDLRSGVKWK